MSMPLIPQYELIAEISKTKGLDGQLVAHEMGRLSFLRCGQEVWIVPPPLEGTRHTRVSEVLENPHKSGVLFRLEGIDDRTKATRLLGRYLLARKEESTEDSSTHPPDTVAADNTVDQGINSTASPGQIRQGADSTTSPGQIRQGAVFTDTTYGKLGCLEYHKQGPAYDIWVLNGPFGKLEIPAVEAYVLDLDTEQVTLALPRGFIEATTPAHTPTDHDEPERQHSEKDEGEQVN